jgi:hypothetical protein
MYGLHEPPSQLGRRVMSNYWLNIADSKGPQVKKSQNQYNKNNIFDAFSSCEFD